MVNDADSGNVKRVADGAWVSFSYTLREAKGEVLPFSDNAIDMRYQHGRQQILPALEKAFIGRTEGEHFALELAALHAYGPYLSERVVQISRKKLIAPPKTLREGQLVKAKKGSQVINGRIVKLGRFMLDLDTNHPFAGKDLVFEIQVTEVSFH